MLVSWGCVGSCLDRKFPPAPREVSLLEIGVPLSKMQIVALLMQRTINNDCSSSQWGFPDTNLSDYIVYSKPVLYSNFIIKVIFKSLFLVSKTTKEVTCNSLYSFCYVILYNVKIRNDVCENRHPHANSHARFGGRMRGSCMRSRCMFVCVR